jgi:hypothetical protein
MKKLAPAPALLLGIAALAVLAISSASAQNSAPAALVAALKPRYQVSKTNYGPNGTVVLVPGTVLVLKQGNLLAAPPNIVGVCATQFKDGALHPPTGFCLAMMGKFTRYLGTGTKFFITKIEYSDKKSVIQFNLIECDQCNGARFPSSFKTAVSFQFPPNFLTGAEPGQVTDVLDQVLAPDPAYQPAQPSSSADPNAAQQPDQGQQPDQSQPNPQDPNQQQPPQPDPAQAAQPQAQPTQIQIGDSPAQVESILGQPTTKIPIANKLIYVYKNLKVTFVNNKVTDVQ